MITPSRLRRFEAALVALLDPKTAALIGTLTAAAVNRYVALPEKPPEILINGEGIDLDLFAAYSNQTRREAYAALVEAHKKARSALGLDLFDDVRSPRGGHDPARGSVVALSVAFQSLLNGTAITALPDEQRPSDQPDVATLKGLDIVATAAAAISGLRFLWRIAASPETASAQLELTRLAASLKGVAGGFSVLVGRRGMNAEKAKSDLTAIALASLLHADLDVVLILPASSAWLKETPALIDEDDSFMGPEEERISASYQIEHGASKFLKMLALLDCTIVLPVPVETVLEPEVAALFAGALGPYRLDRASALADVKTQAEGVLGDREAAIVLRAVRDPLFASEILRGAAVIATSGADAAANGSGMKAAWLVPKDATSKSAQRNRRTLKQSELFAAGFNRAAEHLAASMLPHVGHPAALGDTVRTLFDPSLFCSDPDPKFLFERAAVLRETGARILLTGPTGTGKSALVHELAKLMALEIRQYTGASLFARAWGQTEKNIAAAAAQSRGYLAFYDEADALMGNRFTESENNRHLTVCATNAFLSAYQDAVPGSPVAAATNRIEDIDPAIRRRFDIILTTKPLPESIEALAWERVLKMTPPVGWVPAGDTVPGDYVKAARQLHLIGACDPILAAAAIVRARDERAIEGLIIARKPMGFVIESTTGAVAFGRETSL